MKYVTYGMHPACQHCGNTWEKGTFSGDWTSLTCNKCGKITPYIVVKEEEKENETKHYKKHRSAP